MAVSTVTFGRLLTYLADLGFTTDEVNGKTRVCRNPDGDPIFLLRDRPLTEHVRDLDLQTTWAQLDFRGLATPNEFAEALGLPYPPRPVARPYS